MSPYFYSFDMALQWCVSDELLVVIADENNQ